MFVLIQHHPNVSPPQSCFFIFTETPSRLPGAENVTSFPQLVPALGFPGGIFHGILGDTSCSHHQILCPGDPGKLQEVTFRKSHHTCVGNWVIQKRARTVEVLDLCFEMISKSKDPGNTWYLWKYNHLIYRKWYLEDLTRNTYLSSLGCRLRDPTNFTGQLPQWNCQGTSEAWTAPVPCAPPGCPARHSCGKSPWEVVFVGKFTQLLREIDGNWWNSMASLEQVKLDSFTTPSISFNIRTGWCGTGWNLEASSADIGGGFNMFQPGLGKKLDT